MCSEGIEDELEGEKLKATVVKRSGKTNHHRIPNRVLFKTSGIFKVPKVYELKEELTISVTGKKIKKIKGGTARLIPVILIRQVILA